MGGEHNGSLVWAQKITPVDTKHWVGNGSEGRTMVLVVKGTRIVGIPDVRGIENRVRKLLASHVLPPQP